MLIGRLKSLPATTREGAHLLTPWSWFEATSKSTDWHYSGLECYATNSDTRYHYVDFWFLLRASTIRSLERTACRLKLVESRSKRSMPEDTTTLLNCPELDRWRSVLECRHTRGSCSADSAVIVRDSDSEFIASAQECSVPHTRAISIPPRRLGDYQLMS